MAANEAIYGPIADAAASKYGLDTGIFRRLISSESSWNPTAINPQSVGGENASGIAQFLPSTASARGVDPFDPYSALDGAAKYLSELTSKFGLSEGIAAYKGYSNRTSEAAQTTASKIIGDSGTVDIRPDGKDPLGNQMGPDSVQKNAKPGNSKSLWQYTSDDWKNLFQNSAWGFLLGAVGVLLVILSIYMLVKRGGTDSIGATRQIAGA